MLPEINQGLADLRQLASAETSEILLMEICKSKNSFSSSAFAAINETRNIYVSLDDADPYASPPKETSEVVLHWAAVPLVKWYISNRDVIAMLVRFMTSSEDIEVTLPTPIQEYVTALSNYVATVRASTMTDP
jgi:hypothetical protein